MKKSHRKCLCALFLILIVLLIAVVVLFFIYRIRPPVVEATPVSLLHFEFDLAPKLILNVLIGVDVYLKNPNFAPFTYKESAAAIYYRGLCVGEAPVAPGKIEARGTRNLGTPVDLLVDRMVDHPRFLPDVQAGVLLLVSTVKTEGHATILGFFKLHATINVECRVIVLLFEGAASSSKCVSNVKV